MTYLLRDDLLRRLKTLNERIWEGHCSQPEIEAWLENFRGETTDAETERLEALYLLSNLSYYGVRELRVLLESVYRDLYRYPVIQRIRKQLGGTTDRGRVAAEFNAHLQGTRFLGMGNPAESGTHMLYYFRQENKLPKDLFINQHQLFSAPTTDPNATFASPSLRHIVFLDDLLGSGQQSQEYGRTILRDIREVSKRSGQDVRISYYVLFARTAGLSTARTSLFDEVEAVHELDDTYLTFGASSRIFAQAPADIDRKRSEEMCRHYGQRLLPGHPLGYRNGQLLLGFHHNIPDNTLPVVWFDGDYQSWEPILPRYPKVY